MLIDEGLVTKIISSGQTGVELAALDVAVKLGLAHGGWTPFGKRNEAGPLPDHLDITEVKGVGFQKAMEQNIKNSDGTLLISRGEKTAGTRFAVETALKHQRQFLHADLSQHTPFEAASLICSWLSLQKIREVFVTGPLDSQDSKIYAQTMKILETAFYLGFVKTGMHPDLRPTKPEGRVTGHGEFPTSVEEAIELLKQALPLKDRTLMANMQLHELEHLRSGLGEYVKQNFGLYSGNKALLDSCMQRSKVKNLLPDEACAIVLRALWEDLQSTHKLRVIK